MNQGKYVFSQILEFVPRHEFNYCVQKHKGNLRIRNFDCRDQLLAMMFGQLTNLRSLRGIIICLNAHFKLLYHLGFKSNHFTLSTLSRANENRSWEIYQDLAQILIAEARKFYLNDNNFQIELEGAVYAIDSTVIDLCVTTFRWAYFEEDRSAIKVHTQLDLRGNIPSFFLITEAKIQDNNFLDALEFEAGAFYVMDRGYFDFKRLWKINQAKAYFVIRAKKRFAFKRMYSNKIDELTGICCDQIIKMKYFNAKRDYQGKLRRIKYYDADTNKYYTFITNNLDLDAGKIADLYRHRWQIELFFKWIKQHLRIEVFWGHSANSVKTQICIAICTFLVVAIMKKRLGIKRDIYEILQILALSQFEKTPINTLISESRLQIINQQIQKQANLLNF